MCWKARLTGTIGMAVNLEILVVATLQHACTKVQARKQNSYSEKEKIENPAEYTFRDAKSWLMHEALPFCIEIFLVAPVHFVGFLQGPTSYSYNDFMGTMGNEGFAMAAKKIRKA